ncbi:hypothetical protein [Shewanella algae]
MMKTTMASSCALALLTGLSLVATAAGADNPVSVETPAYGPMHSVPINMV